MNIGIISSFLLFVASLTGIFRLVNQPMGRRFAFVSLLVIASLVPVSSLNPALYIRAIFGDLSITTQLIMAAYLFGILLGQSSTSFPKPNYLHFALFVVLTAIWFYPMALGMTYFDPYNLGFDGVPMHWFVLVYFLISTVYFLIRSELWISCMLSIATLAFYLGLLESDNYWDYMIDPILVIGSFIYLCLQWRSKPRNAADPSKD